MVQMTVQAPDVQLGMIKKGYCVLSDEYKPRLILKKEDEEAANPTL